MKDAHARSVTMLCSTCGGSSFEFQDGDGPVKCIGCDRSYTRDELIAENGAVIDDGVVALTENVMADIRKDIAKMFKRFK